MQDLINESGLEFTDISSESYREYNFGPDGIVQINNPLWLNVSEHGHRLFDANGFSYYIPYGWISLAWRSKLDKPNFVK